MRRPGVNEKVQIDSEHEPDLWAISRISPVPENKLSPDVEAILDCTLRGGPKARMPVAEAGGRGMSSSSRSDRGVLPARKAFSTANTVENPSAVSAPEVVMTSSMALVQQVPLYPLATLESSGEALLVMTNNGNNKREQSCGVDESLLDSLLVLRQAQTTDDGEPPCDVASSSIDVAGSQDCSRVNEEGRPSSTASGSACGASTIASQIRECENNMLADQQSLRSGKCSQVVNELLAQLFLVTQRDINPTVL
jgi:hypothetical protein